jgi:hypothetical protein
MSMGSQFGSGNPYPEGGRFLQANGYQQWISAGIYGSFGILSIQFQPDYFFIQNKNYVFFSITHYSNVVLSDHQKVHEQLGDQSCHHYL